MPDEHNIVYCVKDCGNWEVARKFCPAGYGLRIDHIHGFNVEEYLDELNYGDHTIWNEEEECYRSEYFCIREDSWRNVPWSKEMFYEKPAD